METWRDRLERAVSASGLSMREASIEAGCGHGYIYKLLRENQEPTLDRITRIVDVLDVSLYWLLTGMDMSKQTEDFTRLYGSLSDDQRASVLSLLGSMTSK